MSKPKVKSPSPSPRMSSLNESSTIQTFGAPHNALDSSRLRLAERQDLMARVSSATRRAERCAQAVATTRTNLFAATEAWQSAMKLERAHREVAASQRPRDLERLAEAEAEATQAGDAHATATDNVNEAKAALDRAKRDLRTARAAYEARG